MAKVILFNKPYGVLTQFSPVAGRMTLKDYVDVPGVYAAGRLDADSEGLVVLTDDGRLQAAISHPKHKARKIYWVQVEGIPDEARLAQLRAGVDLGDFVTKPCLAGHLEPPSWLWARDPPIRYRASIPTSWLEVQLTEGKNRQVRRMTAKVGHPTLRLVRWAVGEWTLSGLKPGEWREIRYAAPAVNQSRRGRVMGND